MSVEAGDLNRWERTAVAVNGRLLEILRDLDRGDLTAVRESVEEAQRLNWQTRSELLTVGAVDSIREKAAQIEAAYLKERADAEQRGS